MENNNEEELVFVEITALGLLTRIESGELIEVGESIEVEEASAEILINKGQAILSKDYVPPVEEGEEEAVEITVEVEVVEEVEEKEEEDEDDYLGELLPDELEIFEN